MSRCLGIDSSTNAPCTFEAQPGQFICATCAERKSAATAGYDAWWKQVQKAMVIRIGLDPDDLPDQTWSDWYEDGYTPDQAVQEALEEVGAV